MGRARRRREEQKSDEVMACANLVERTGALGFEIGFLDETSWWATARYKGAKIMVEGNSSPDEAARALAKKLLRGARCACGKLASLSPFGAVALRSATMADGSVFTIEEARRAGQCLWQLKDGRWVPACGTS